MKKETTYNGKTIVSIKLSDKRKSYYKYYPEKKKKWYRPYNAEYFKYYHWYYTREEIEKEGCIVIDNIVYWKPYVKINFTNGETFERLFSTFEEAKDFYETIKETFIPLTDRIEEII